MQLPPPPHQMPGYGPAPATPPSRRSMLATAGGITAIVALPVLLAACILPYANYSSSDGGPYTPSIFNADYPGSWSNILEPALVMLFTLVAAILLIASTHRLLGALTAGALLAMGAQTAALFFGYAVTSIAGGQIGAGSVVGLLGGAILFVAGALSAAGLLSSTAPGGS
jgi:hypothetical protein